MSDIVKVCWSGGKDSTASSLLHLDRGDLVSLVCYVPMFDDRIPLISKQHHDFILYAKSRFELLGANVFLVHGLSFVDYVLHVSLKGKFKGQIFGFPTVGRGQCGFKRDSKLKALAGADSLVGSYDYEDIGIAYDEVSRFGQLSDRKRSILVELKKTESDCLSLVFDRNLLSPHYGANSRDGCVLCCNSSVAERSSWLSDYPDALPKLLWLEDVVRSERSDRPPLRNYKYFSDFL